MFSRKGRDTMIGEPQTATVEQQIAILYHEIGRYLQHGFVPRSRTATSALLLKPRRYNRLAGLAFGLIFYYIWFALFASDIAVTLDVDPRGTVIRRQGKTRTQRASRKKGSVVLAVVAVLAIVAFGLNGLAAVKGCMSAPRPTTTAPFRSACEMIPASAWPRFPPRDSPSPPRMARPSAVGASTCC